MSAIQKDYFCPVNCVKYALFGQIVPRRCHYPVSVHQTGEGHRPYIAYSMLSSPGGNW
jgi:hypothetical protein